MYTRHVFTATHIMCSLQHTLQERKCIFVVCANVCLPCVCEYVECVRTCVISSQIIHLLSLTLMRTSATRKKASACVLRVLRVRANVYRFKHISLYSRVTLALLSRVPQQQERRRVCVRMCIIWKHFVYCFYSTTTLLSLYSHFTPTLLSLCSHFTLMCTSATRNKASKSVLYAIVHTTYGRFTILMSSESKVRVKCE